MEDKEAQKELGHIQFVEETINEDGSAFMTFDLDDAAEKLMAEFGLRLTITCAAYGLDIEDAFLAVSARGEYLQQTPEQEVWDIG